MTMTRSIIAFLVALVLGFLSMGALGGGLYLAVSPLLTPVFGRLDSWSGDWVWPATITAGMAWSSGFLAAGWIDQRLARRSSHWLLRLAVYAAVLYGAAVTAWTVALVLYGPRT